MMVVIEAEDAWWLPTFSPEGLGRTRFAWSTIAVESHSTRLSTSRNTDSLSGSGKDVPTLGWVPGTAVMSPPFPRRGSRAYCYHI